MQGYCLLLAASLSLATPIAIAAPQDPARVDGSRTADPAAVFPQAARTPRASGLSRALAPRSGSTLDRVLQHADGPDWQGIAPLAPERYRQAYGNADVRARLGRTYSIGSSNPSGTGSWLQSLLSPQNGRLQQDFTLQQGVRTAQDAMDEMGRQLLPALRDIKREFNDGLDRASTRD